MLRKCIRIQSFSYSVKGLRMAVVLSAGCQFFGSVFRCIPTGENWTISTVLICFGQVLSTIVAPISSSAGVLVSATWFPSNQRTTSTAISMAGPITGIALSFIIGPLFVDDIGSTHYSQVNSIQRNIYFKQIRNLCLVESGLMGLLFLAVIIHYPAKPPHLPSRSSGTGRMSTKSGIFQLLKNRNFLLLALLYGTTSGVYGGWSSVLDQNLQGFGIGQTFAGWLGFIAIVSGAFSGVFFSM
jgi:FLVCR family MFS transporter